MSRTAQWQVKRAAVSTGDVRRAVIALHRAAPCIAASDASSSEAFTTTRVRQNRARSIAIQADRARQDPRESAEVRHPRRDDRPQGTRPGQHSACRSSTCPHFRYGKNGSGGVGQGEGEEGTPIGPAASRRTARARPAAIPAPTSSKSKSRSTSWPQILGDELRTAAHRAQGQGEHQPGEDPLHQHPPLGPESLRHFKRTYMQALRRQISSNTYDAARPARSCRSARTSAIAPGPTIPQPQANAVDHLHDGRVGLDDRRAEGDRPHRGLLDRYLAQEPIRRARNALHHPRRGGQGGRRGDVLSHPRKRRHADQLGLQGVRRSDRTRVSAQRLEHLLLPVFRRRQLGRGQRNRACDCCANDCCRRSNLFCYGQVESPYGSGEYHPVAADAAFGDNADNLVLSEIENKEAIYDIDQAVSGQREM